jgi:transposase
MDYVGIDLHKRESQIFVFAADGKVHEKRIKTDRAQFAKTLPQLAAAGSRVLLEASTESAWAAKALKALGYDVIVADPNYSAMYGTRQSRRIKTDRRDARALADACRIGNYRVAHQSSDEARRRRNLLTTREQLVGMRTKCIVTSRSILRQHGYAVGKGEAETFARRVRAVELETEVGAAVAPLLVTLESLTVQIAGVDARLEAIVKDDERVRRLTTVFGVGPITAVAFQATIEDPKRFRNAHKAEAYLGLVPGEHSSGDGTRRTSITKTGSPLMRWLLVQAALVFMRHGRSRAPALHSWVQGVGQRRGSKVARVALARRLAGILFALLRDGAVFDGARYAPQLSS